MNKTTKIFAWITGTLFIGGICFKCLHFPGASPMLLLSSFFYLVFYLPMWLAATLKRKEFPVFYIIQYVVLNLFMIAGLCKMMHWPGATQFFFAGLICILLALVPSLILKMRKQPAGDGSNIHRGLLLVFFLSFYINYHNGGISYSLINAMNMGGMRTEASLKKAELKSRKLYEYLGLISDKTTHAGLGNVEVLKKRTDSTINYIHHLKAFLIHKTDQIPLTQADSTRIGSIVHTMNQQIPTAVLIGGNYLRPVTGPHSGAELKKVIELFRDSVINLVDKDQQSLIRQGINLPTNDETDPDSGEEVPWEVATFYNMPLNEVYTSLSTLEYEVRNTEAQILTSLLNKVTSADKTNMAARMAELGVKYESEMKEQQLSLAKKDKELLNAQMRDKQESLDSMSATIVYFILGLVAFAVMLFYIIRSNMVRKKLNKELASQKAEVEKQKELVEEKQHEIIDSITYAKRLQQAILPALNTVKQYLPHSFIYYQPKDIVAGDFYWMHTADNEVYLAAADCTGHGVPGAMVSVVCSNALNRAVNEFRLSETGLILDKTRELVMETFEKSGNEVTDGMDISLIRIGTGEKRTIQWSGANNALWYIQDKELTEVKADKQPVGKYSAIKPFTTHNLELNGPVTFYLFSDGFADQFGPEEKKLMKKKFRDIISSIQHLDMAAQHEYLHQFHEKWKGSMEQTDDVMVIGVRI
ncbi:MAG: SpoIIE family protein phosphatase [Bacteroidia bacterium]